MDKGRVGGGWAKVDKKLSDVNIINFAKTDKGGGGGGDNAYPPKGDNSTRFVLEPFPKTNLSAYLQAFQFFL